MSWFKKLIPSRVSTEVSARKKTVPEGLWITCTACSAILYKSELEKNVYVCPRCQHHLRIGARERIELFLDEEGRTELATDVEPNDVLKFRDSKRYKDRLLAAQKKTNEKDALVVFKGTVEQVPVVACAFEFSFIGGSMGAAVGERFVRGAQCALEEKKPLVCFAASGGARMQEAIISLLQMAKTSAALADLAEQGIPYISVLTDPTYGGVTASLAMLGDINIAEPKAMIGFAGPRVIAQTVRETLPEGFQTSEFLLAQGIIDMIVDRREMRSVVSRLIRQMSYHLVKSQSSG